MAADSSGWAKASAVAHDAFHPVALARSASDKARLSKNPREIAPGRYTVILEPAAVLDLVGQMFGDFSATAMRDQRSFLTGRMGTKLFGDNIHISDDVAHPLQAGVPFDGEGVPRRKLTLVEAGVPRELAYSRASAKRAGVAPTGHGFPLPNDVGEAPLNIVIAGGDTPVERMIASTERGILVTRLWYIREVDPFEKIMTGMTRDGTFLIEDGRLSCGLEKFPLQPGNHRIAEQGRGAFRFRARIRRRSFRHGGAGHEGARLQFHRSNPLLKNPGTVHSFPNFHWR